MKGPTVLLRDAFALFQAHPRLFISIYLVPGLLTLLFDIVAGKEMFVSNRHDIDGTEVLLGLALLIVQVLFSLAMMKAISSPNTVTMESAYQSAFDLFFPVLWVSLISTVLVILGVIALIIPGIILAVWFLFSSYTAVFEGKRGIEALKASKEHVRGKWWAVFGRLAVLVLLAIPCGIVMTSAEAFIPGDLDGAFISFVFGGIAMPIAFSYIYLMYQDVRNLKPVVAEHHEPMVVEEKREESM